MNEGDITLVEAAARIPLCSVKAIRRLLAQGKWPRLRRSGPRGAGVIASANLPKLRAALIKAKLVPSDEQIEFLREDFARLGLSTDHLPPKK